MIEKFDKTNVMRILDQKKIPYNGFCFTDVMTTKGTEIPEILGENPKQVFKTLVTIGKSGNHYVFVIPVEKSLHLKKAAKVVNEKSIDMILQKDLLPKTGYIHGGCSPIGMKKFFKTTFDLSAKEFDEIYFSAGKVGFQVKIHVSDISKVIPITFEDVCEE